MTSPDHRDPVLDPGDRALAALVERGLDDRDPLLTRPQLADRTGVSEVLLEAVEREGFLAPATHDPDGEPRYRPADADAVAAGSALLEAGLPLGELLDLARRFDAAARDVADVAVETFLRYVRDPVQGTTDDAAEAAQRLADAFTAMLPAAGAVVGHHFQRLLLERARARLEARRSPGEVA